MKPGRCTAQSFRILVTLRDKVDSRSIKNKERKSRLTGSSSNYDSPRNHQGIVESRSIRTHTSIFSHLRRCGFDIGLPDNRRQRRQRRVTCSHVTYRSCTIRNEPTIPIKHLHNSGRREFRCYARTNMIFLLVHDSSATIVTKCIFPLPVASNLVEIIHRFLCPFYVSTVSIHPVCRAHHRSSRNPFRGVAVIKSTRLRIQQRRVLRDCRTRFKTIACRCPGIPVGR